MIELGHRAAKSTIPVLIEGESGVGKELIARAIQGESAPQVQALRHRQLRRHPRKSGREHPVRPREGLLHRRRREARRQIRRGRRRHAVPRRDRRAAARRCRSSCCAPCRTARSIRSARKQPVKVDFRLISATNQNLIDLVSDGRFREDLYYRLNVFPIWVPPLRERLRRRARSRAPFHRALRRRGRQAHRRHRRRGARHAACATSWPGNIRQLENAVFRAVVLADAPMLTVNEFPQIAAHVEGYAVTVPPAPAPKDRHRASRARSCLASSPHARHHSCAAGQWQGRHRHSGLQRLWRHPLARSC